MTKFSYKISLLIQNKLFYPLCILQYYIFAFGIYKLHIGIVYDYLIIYNKNNKNFIVKTTMLWELV